MIASVIRARPARLAPAGMLLLAAALVSGCSMFPRSAPEPALDVSAIVDDFPRSRRVAIDFVDAMTALPALVPGDTTLFTTRPPSRFGEILIAALQSAGYDLRLGVDDSPVTFDYDVRSAGGEGGTSDGRYIFLVVANGVRLERRYVADLAGIRADSAMRVDGRDVTTPARGAMTSLAPRAVANRPQPPGSAAMSPAPPLPSVNSPGVDRTASRGRATDAATVEIGLTKLAPPPIPIKRNLYDTRRSNYDELLARYDTVRREIMVFPNDSLHMGADNKRLARRIAAAFDPERDVISVIGCSHGRTALENGNEMLANGRSYRVKEAFMLAGIAADRVLEEGCWAGIHFSEMPARGVVVTHKRRAAG